MVESKTVSSEDQREYWSSESVPLFLVIQSRPDVANMTKELSQVNDGANPVGSK